MYRGSVYSSVCGLAAADSQTHAPKLGNISVESKEEAGNHDSLKCESPCNDNWDQLQASYASSNQSPNTPVTNYVQLTFLVK